MGLRRRVLLVLMQRMRTIHNRPLLHLFMHLMFSARRPRLDMSATMHDGGMILRDGVREWCGDTFATRAVFWRGALGRSALSALMRSPRCIMCRRRQRSAIPRLPSIRTRRNGSLTLLSLLLCTTNL